MFKDSRQEYMIKTCPTSDVEKLEALLNDMAKNGWDLYSMSEAEAENGDYQYNCIFIREFEEDDEIEEDDSINVGDFCSKMEKITPFGKSAHPISRLPGIRFFCGKMIRWRWRSSIPLTRRPRKYHSRFRKNGILMTPLCRRESSALAKAISFS